MKTPQYTLFLEDSRTYHENLEPESVDCVITSPPYWRKRDYGFAEQIGGPESEPDQYVADIVAVFENLEPYLKKGATLWINFGDVFDRHGFLDLPAKIMEMLTRVHSRMLPDEDPYSGIDYPPQMEEKKVQPKFKCLQRIIWHKPNGRPESCPNRCTQKTEVIYLLVPVKQGNLGHYFDDKSIREETGAKCTNLWRINNESNRKKHTATFPKELVRRCLGLGCPPAICSCGLPRFNGYTVEAPDKSWLDYCGAQSGGNYAGKNLKDYKGAKAEPASDAKRRILESMKVYRPAGMEECPCGSPDFVPAVVLDPFMGTGTTGEVAIRSGRSFIGVEKNPEYYEMATASLELLMTEQKLWEKNWGSGFEPFTRKSKEAHGA